MLHHLVPVPHLTSPTSPAARFAALRRFRPGPADRLASEDLERDGTDPSLLPRGQLRTPLPARVRAVSGFPSLGG